MGVSDDLDSQFPLRTQPRQQTKTQRLMDEKIWPSRGTKSSQNKPASVQKVIIVVNLDHPHPSILNSCRHDATRIPPSLCSLPSPPPIHRGRLSTTFPIVKLMKLKLFFFFALPTWAPAATIDGQAHDTVFFLQPAKVRRSSWFRDPPPMICKKGVKRGSR